jgi:hypothetical protein
MDWTSLVTAWLPLVVLLGVFFYITRSQGMRSRGPSGASLIELYEQQVSETRRMNGILERVAVALEKRAQSG